MKAKQPAVNLSPVCLVKTCYPDCLLFVLEVGQGRVAFAPTAVGFSVKFWAWPLLSLCTLPGIAEGGDSLCVLIFLCCLIYCLRKKR
jgi:hypothetical protein